MSNRSLNVALVANPGLNQVGDFEKVAGYMREAAPDVRPSVWVDRHYRWQKYLLATRPTFAFSPVPTKQFILPRGVIAHGQPLAKSEEYAALEKAGIPIPRYRVLTEQNPRPADLTTLGEYVVLKPDRGGRGAMVKIVRSGRAKWEPAETKIAGESDALLAQEFIYTGPWPISYRVTTLYGQVLWSLKQEASHERKPLSGPEGFKQAGGVTVVSNSKGCTMSLNFEQDVIAFAERAHVLALPDVPLLGIDVIRDATTGKLYVVELNSIGYVWHFSSPLGLRAQKEFGFSLEGQFDGLRKAASILADKARELAA
jgi:hypothetical protein